METKLEFKGTGGELFKSLLGGLLLTGITFGIYYPWFLVSLSRLILSRTEARVGDRPLSLSYTATGGALLKELFIGYFLTMVTFGIYLPWLLMRLVRFQEAHTVGVLDDRSYRLHTRLTGGQLFKTIFVGWLLTGVTFGIYAPWMLVKLISTVAAHTELRDEQEAVGRLQFTVTGGQFFKTFLLGYFLTMVTFGVYAFWFQVKLLALFARGTELEIGTQRYRADYSGTGGELFKLGFVGYFLTMVTFGVYGFWFMANLLRYQLAHTRVLPAEAAVAAAVERPVARAKAQAPSPVQARPLSAPQLRPASPPRASLVAPSVALALDLPDPVAPGPRAEPPAPARPLTAPPAPASKARAASAPRAVPVPRVRSVEVVASGDRRAAWARAFLPPEGPLGGEESQATMPHPMSLEHLAEVWTDSVSSQSPHGLN